MHPYSLRISLFSLILAAVSPNLQGECWTECVDWECCCPCECIPCQPICGEWLPVIVDDCGCVESALCNACEAEPTPKTVTPTPTETHKAAEPTTPLEAPALDKEAVPPTEETPAEQAEQAPAEVTPPPAETAPAEPVDAEPAEILPPTPGPAETTPPQPEGEPVAAEAHPADIFVEPAQETTEEATPEEESKPSAVESPAPAEEPTEEPAEQPSAEDIFGEPAQPAESETDKPAEEQPPVEEEKQEPAADPFDPFTRLDLPTQQNMAGISGHDIRVWTLRSSPATRIGTLVGATRGAVVLQQEDGALCSVAYRDLSQSDLLYVRSQVRWQRALEARPEAGTQLAVGGSP